MTTEDQPLAVYLGLGSNLGDREANLRQAIERIKGLVLRVVRASSIYETEPVGYKDQPWFLNQVIEVSAAPSPDPVLCARDLLCALLKIEREMGRERDIPNGPRVIDIDILIYGEMEGLFCATRPQEDDAGISESDPPRLILPHPRLHERRFVLEPLAEIAPEQTHPRLKKSFRELLAALDDPSIVNRYKRGEQFQ